jgi:hypothetical protein
MNETVNVNKEYKDSVFSLLFSNPDALRELYSAIAGVELPPDISIDINTLSDVLIKGFFRNPQFGGVQYVDNGEI